MMRTFKAFEDNAGGLVIFEFEDGKQVWACSYTGRESDMGVEWDDIVLAKCDPVADEWEQNDIDAADWLGWQIADSTWDHVPHGIDVDACGVAGRLFAMHAGAASYCHECGFVIPAERDDYAPSGWHALEKCPSCGEATEILI